MAPSKNPQSDTSSDNPYEPPKTESGAPQPGQKSWLDARASGRTRAAPAAQFTLDCQCGRAIAVAGSQAGSTVACECGAAVQVPSLGKLRESSGKGRYESGITDTVQRMVQTGELPGGHTCAVSGKPTDDVIELEIFMPRFFKGQEDPRKAPLIIMFGIWSLIYLALVQRTQFAEEGGTAVQVPLRVARRSHKKVRRMSQRRLKQLLRTVPVYAQLLEENPDARISVDAGAWDSAT